MAIGCVPLAKILKLHNRLRGLWNFSNYVIGCAPSPKFFEIRHRLRTVRENFEINADTLLSVLQEYVIPGLTVVSDIWRAKQRNKKECGTHQTLLTTYLTKFMWRMKFGHDLFENLLQHIQEVYPL